MDSGENFLSREFEGFILAQNLLYPLDNLAYGAFVHRVIGPDGLHGTVFTVVFECYPQLISTRKFEAVELDLDVLESIKACTKNITPLYDNIRTEV